ncbi:hypothetical protein GCM10009737_22060 [Nocardioides lentus]|uniref:Lipopolysaccharide biosynthesis protein n=1 Tax=Nocardioides lentus TaxID=338077 RepID=A0ABN2PF26_9ACTN
MTSPHDPAPAGPAPEPDPERPGGGGRTLRERIGRVAAASAAAVVFGQLVSLVQTVALARLLSPTEVGWFAAGSVLTAFASNVVEGGLRAGLVQREDRLDDAAETVFRATIVSGFLTMLLALGIAPLVALVFDSRTAGLVAASMAGGVFLFAFTNVPEALLQREFSVRRRLVVGPAVAVSFAVVSVTLAALGLGVWSMVIGSYASTLTWVATLWWICDWRPGRGRASLPMYRELVHFGFPLALGLFAEQTEKGVQAGVTGHVLGASGLGLFRYGERIAQIPVGALVEVSSVALFPAFSRIADDADRFRQSYLRALGLVVTAAAGVTALLVAIGEPLVVLVLGEQWRGAGVVLVAMAGLGLGKAFTTVSEEAIKGAGRTSLLNWYTLTEFTLTIALLLALVGPLGLVGVGLSVSVTALLVGLTVMTLARPVVGVRWRDLAATTLPAIVAAAGAGDVTHLLETELLRAETHSVLLGLALLALAGLVMLTSYVVLLRVLAPRAYRAASDVALTVLRRLRPRP